MSSKLEERVGDWAKWFTYNRAVLPSMDLKKRCDFMDKALLGCFELLALAMEDVRRLEGREPHPNLWIPTDLKINESIRT